MAPPNFIVRRTEHRSNALAATATLLAQLGVAVTESALREQLLTHPRYPSLVSVAETLQDFGVTVQPVHGTIDELDDIAYPNLAQLRGDGGHLVVLTGVKGGTVTVADPARGILRLSREDFAKDWSGVILLAAAGEQAGDSHHGEQFRRELERKLRLALGWTLLAIAALVWLPWILVTSTPPWGLLTLDIVGLVTSTVLSRHHLAGGSSLMNRICKPGRMLDCNRVLQSPAAALGGMIAVSDLAIVYFMGNLLVRLIEPQTVWLTLLSVAVLPYTLFAVGYMAFKVRAWCSLCLLVHGVLWAQALVQCDFTLNSGWDFNADSLITSLPILTAWLIPGALIIAGVPAFKKLLESDAIELELQRFRRDPVTLMGRLQRQVPVAPPPPGPVPVAGSPDSPVTLTLVSQPLCHHCRRRHRELEALLARSGGRLRVEHRLLPPPGPATEIARHILARLFGDVPGDAARLLDDWFASDKPDFTTWCRLHAVADSTALEKADAWLATHQAWGASQGFRGTPILLLDGRRLPILRRLSDLAPLLPQQVPSASA